MKAEQNRKEKPSVLFIVIFAVLTVYVLTMAFPLLWGMFTSLKDQTEFRKNVLWLPHGWPWEWKWSNFVRVSTGFYETVTTVGVGRKRVYFPKMLVNTLLYAGGCAFLATICPCVVAYLTAKFNYKFSRFINALVVALMVMPIVGSAPSEMQILKGLRLYDNMWGMWICKFSFLGMYYLIFLAAFKGISNDFLEAAYVDGASEMRVLLSIALPMVRNVIGTVFLIKFIDFWNDYQTPLLYMPSSPVLARGIFRLSQDSQGDFATIPFRMAECMLLALPILVLFVVFKDKLMGNLSMGGIKE